MNDLGRDWVSAEQAWDTLVGVVRLVHADGVREGRSAGPVLNYATIATLQQSGTTPAYCQELSKLYD
jgi:hypothetical protein